MIDENRYRGTPESWNLHNQNAREGAWSGRAIDENSIRVLPKLAQASFVSRCARRARFLLIQRWQGSKAEGSLIDELVEFVDEFGRSTGNRNMRESFHEADALYRKCGEMSSAYRQVDGIAGSCIEAIYDAGRFVARLSAQIGVLENQYDPASAAGSSVHQLRLAAYAHAGNQLCHVHRGIEADFELLRFIAERDQWQDDTALTARFYQEHSEFDILYRFGQFGNIRELAQGLNAGWNDAIVHYPREILEMESSKRHAFLSTFLSPLGFRIDLVIPTVSASEFIIGISHESYIKQLLLLSRHAPGGNRALIPVNRLHGHAPTDPERLLFSTAFLMDRPAQYELRVSPATLTRASLNPEHTAEWNRWLDEHQQWELRRDNVQLTASYV